MIHNRESIGQRFLLARKACGLTSEKAAERLNISRSYLSQIENKRKTNITLDLLLDAAMLYGVSPAYMLGLQLPPYAEVANALYVRGLLAHWYNKANFDICKKMCEEVGFDPVPYCKQLGLEWQPTSDEILAPGVFTPLPTDLPGKKEE